MRRWLLSALTLSLAGLAADAQPSATDRAQAERRFIAALAELVAGNPDRVPSHLSEVLALYPDDPAVLDVLAEAYQAQGEVSDALYYAEAAARLAPTEATLHARLATLYEEAGDAARAQRARDEARRLSPARDHLSPASSLQQTTSQPAALPVDGEIPGAAAYRAGRYAEAADALLGVVEADPRQIAAWEMLLDALARTQDSRAGDTADLAVLLFPTVPSLLTPAAGAFASAGRTADARDAANAALAALDGGPDDPALRAQLQSLLSSLD